MLDATESLDNSKHSLRNGFCVGHVDSHAEDSDLWKVLG